MFASHVMKAAMEIAGVKADASMGSLRKAIFAAVDIFTNSHLKVYELKYKLFFCRVTNYRVCFS